MLQVSLHFWWRVSGGFVLETEHFLELYAYVLGAPSKMGDSASKERHGPMTTRGHDGSKMAGV